MREHLYKWVCRGGHRHLSIQSLLILYICKIETEDFSEEMYTYYIFQTRIYSSIFWACFNESVSYLNTFYVVSKSC